MGCSGGAECARLRQVVADYTFANAVTTRGQNEPRLVCAAPEWSAVAPHLPRAVALAARSSGEPVVDHRTSWVRGFVTPGGYVFVKTYEYKTWASRLRDFAKRTAPWTHSRARREWIALAWLTAAGLQPAAALAVFEHRRLGFLTQATLVTRALPGEPCDRLLPRLHPSERELVAAAIGRFVAALHARGFRDQNLDLRNLVADLAGPSCRIAKIDSPRHRHVGAGRRGDRLARADWARLLPQLAAHGVADAALAAAAQPVGSGQASAAASNSPTADDPAADAPTTDGPSTSRMRRNR